MVRSLPLPTGFFKPLDLSPSDESELLSWSQQTLVPQLVLDSKRSPQNDPRWKYVSNKAGVELFEDRQNNGFVYSIRAHTSIQASLCEIVHLFQSSSNTDQQRIVWTSLIGDHLVDTAVLHHRKEDKSTLALKWMAMKSHSPLSPDQDMCVLEYTGSVPPTLDTERTTSTFVCCYESLAEDQAIEYCPSLLESHRLSRQYIHQCGYVITPSSSSSCLDVNFFATIRGTKRANRRMVQDWAQLSLTRLSLSLTQTRIVQTLVSQHQPVQWVQDADRPWCHICLKTFSNLRRRHHCRMCGEITCTKCSNETLLSLPAVGPTNVRLCRCCVESHSKSPAESAQPQSPPPPPQAASESEGPPRPPSYSSVALGAAPSSMSSTALVTTPTSPLRTSLGGSGTDHSGTSEHSHDGRQQQQQLTVPEAGQFVTDRTGVMWLQQMIAKDPSKAPIIESFIHKISNMDQHEEESSSEESSEKDTDTDPEDDIYDCLCALASQTLDCQFAIVYLATDGRFWFKSSIAVDEEDVPRDFSFCDVPLATERPLIVRDASKDEAFASNAFVSGSLQVKFIAGAPLFDTSGTCVGSVCVLDSEPRNTLDPREMQLMDKLAKLAMISMQERQEPQKPATLDMESRPSRGYIHPEDTEEHQKMQQSMFALLAKSHATGKQVDAAASTSIA